MIMKKCLEEKHRLVLGNKRGITLIELAVILMVLGVAVPPLMNLFAQIAQHSVQSEFRIRSYSIAKGLLEEVLSKRYDENTSEPWSTTLGTDGEASRQEFNDIDDFDDYTDSSIAGYPGFSSSVTVYYVDPDNYDFETVRPDSSQTDYKRIDVRISHSKIGTILLSSIVSAHVE